ncbi:MAG: hypothetical protein MI757_23285, partial [Pirellulales bacterium]|nr:hypothetical protein [Pirellulales bacterium]
LDEVEIGPFPELKVASADDGVFVPKFAGDVHYEKERESFVWPARTCTNPDCSGVRSGKPVVFAHPLPGVTLDADGRPVLPRWSDEENRAHLPRCPLCNETRFVVKYDSPEVAERRRVLLAELAATRRARIEAKQSGQPLPASIRTPNAIMQDLANLPMLYLEGK